MTWHIKYFPDDRDHSRANYKGVDQWIAENQGKHFCQCGCGGVITITITMHSKAGISKFLSGHNTRVKKFREKQAARAQERTGENAANWRGGVTKKNEILRKSKPYIAWRKAVFARDNYTCQKCNARSEKGYGKTVHLHAHHAPKTFKQLWKEFVTGLRTKKSLFDPALGVTLCVPCHRKAHHDLKLLRK